MAAKSKSKQATTGTNGTSKAVPVLAQPILDDTLLATLKNFSLAGFPVSVTNYDDALVIRIGGMARCANPACRKFAPREFVHDTGCVHCTERASTGTPDAQP